MGGCSQGLPGFYEFHYLNQLRSGEGETKTSAAIGLALRDKKPFALIVANGVEDFGYLAEPSRIDGSMLVRASGLTTEGRPSIPFSILLGSENSGSVTIGEQRFDLKAGHAFLVDATVTPTKVEQLVMDLSKLTRGNSREELAKSGPPPMNERVREWFPSSN